MSNQSFKSDPLCVVLGPLHFFRTILHEPELHFHFHVYAKKAQIYMECEIFWWECLLLYWLFWNTSTGSLIEIHDIVSLNHHTHKFLYIICMTWCRKCTSAMKPFSSCTISVSFIGYQNTDLVKSLPTQNNFTGSCRPSNSSMICDKTSTFK